MRIVLLLIAVFGISAAQEAELQCRCRLLQGDEYLCKCVAAKAAASSSSTVMLPMPGEAKPAAAGLRPPTKSGSEPAKGRRKNNLTHLGRECSSSLAEFCAGSDEDGG